MIFKFIKRHLTGTINRVGEWKRTVHRGEFSLHHYYKQNLRRKNVTEFLVVFFITFILYNNPTLNNCFHTNQQINQLINNQMEKELFKLS